MGEYLALIFPASLSRCFLVHGMHHVVSSSGPGPICFALPSNLKSSPYKESRATEEDIYSDNSCEPRVQSDKVYELMEDQHAKEGPQLEKLFDDVSDSPHTTRRNNNNTATMNLFQKSI